MDTPFLGMIQYFAFSFVPRGYASCNGALLSISANSALFSLLGVTYGGDGRTTFGLPEMRGRAMMGFSNSHSLGEKMGVERTTLLTSNMPSHSHTGTASISAFVDTRNGGDSTDPVGNYPASPIDNNTMYTATPDAGATLAGTSVIVGSTGSGTPFSTMNPYLAVNCTIALVGLYPSRS